MVVDYLVSRDADRMFHALADATRRDLLRQVIVDGTQSVSALGRRYDMSLTAVQKHVVVLEKAGLVSRQRKGRESVVQAEIARVQQALAVLAQLEQLWRGRVAQMDEILTEQER